MPHSLKLLTVAPSTSHPPMIGDAKRIHRLSRGFLMNGVENVYVGKNFIYRGDDNIVQVRAQQFREWPRSVTGILAVLQRGHYNEVKHCTRRWLNFVKPFLADPTYDAVYCHFVFTYPLLSALLKGRPLVIDTHNSEWEWYDSFASATRNPLIKRVCRFSKQRATAVMRLIPSGTIMAHVSEADAAVYREVRPDLTHLVVPNGGDVIPRAKTPDYTLPQKTLLFFASLHGKMSLDALQHMAHKFWPVVKHQARMLVAGAHPSPAIRQLCQQHGWQLKQDLTEEQVDEVFASAHFSVLPFTYGAGSKLKFFDACLRGVPVLSTAAGACGQASLPRFVTVSDDPQVWLQRIQHTNGLDHDWQVQVATFGEEYNWKAIAARVIPHLQARVDAAGSALHQRHPQK